MSKELDATFVCPKCGCSKVTNKYNIPNCSNCRSLMKKVENVMFSLGVNER